jgi:hypothetical protein
VINNKIHYPFIDEEKEAHGNSASCLKAQSCAGYQRLVTVNPPTWVAENTKIEV